MSTTKNINARVALKHDIEANWVTAGEHGFCPLAGEVIIYDIQEGICSALRYKIGKTNSDGELININDLPFETNLYIGTEEPLYAPPGFLWVIPDELTRETLLTCIREGGSGDGENKYYEFEPGMTWLEWINSPYNVDNFCAMYVIDYYGESLGLGIFTADQTMFIIYDDSGYGIAGLAEMEISPITSDNPVPYYWGYSY